MFFIVLKMPTREILNSHSVTDLKKEIAKTNIKGYSKMKKPEIVSLMLKHKDRFSHIKHKEKVKKPAKKPRKEEPRKEEPRKKGTIKDVINEIIELYGKEGIKKKKNDFKNIEQVKKFYNPYFTKSQRVEDFLKDKDAYEWFEKNMSVTIGKKYIDTTKNFVRRMKPIIREVKKK